MSELVRSKASLSHGKWRQKLRNQRTLILMVLPAMLAYFLFSYLPLLGWSMAFVRYIPGRNLFNCEFVGLKYFIEFFTDTSDAFYVIRNTLCINVLSVISVFLCSVVFSIMLSEIALKKFSRGVQIVSLFPFFLSWVIAYSLVYALFGLESGAINTLLISLGVIDEGVNVLGNAYAAWPMMIMLSVWKSLGYYSIIFLSSIVAIPSEEFEAAAIDGATRWQKVRYITLPNLKQVFCVMVILESGSILSSNLEQFFAFTNSQNWESMVVIDMYIYKYGLGRGEFSYATAVGMIRTVISILLVFTANRLSKKYADQSVF